MQLKNRRRIFIGVLLTVLLIIAWLFIYHPTGGSELQERIKNTVTTSCVLIMQESTFVSLGNEESKTATSTGTAYSAGASGTIIKHEGDRYYVLTAYHVIKTTADATSSTILVLDHDDKEKIEHGDIQKYQGIENFYKRFPKARIEFFNQDYDLAVISFVSKENYATVEIADKLPRVGAIVGTLSNPRENERNTITSGRIIGNRTVASSLKFYGVKYQMFTHTARGADGSSGGMVLNNKLQLVGVTLGGTEIKLFALQFSLTGIAMPCDRILAFLMENEFKI